MKANQPIKPKKYKLPEQNINLYTVGTGINRDISETYLVNSFKEDQQRKLKPYVQNPIAKYSLM